MHTSHSLNRKVALLLTCLLCFTVNAQSSEPPLNETQSQILEPPEMIQDWYTPSIIQLDEPITVQAELVVADPINGCDEFVNADQFKDRIVLSLSGGGCGREEKMIAILKLGAVGVVSISSYTGGAFDKIDSYCLQRKSETRELYPTTPLVCAAYDQEFLDKVQNTKVVAKVVMLDNNYSNFVASGEYAVFQVAGLLPCVAVLFYSVFKLYQLVQEKWISVATLSLACIVVCTILRIFYFLDPQGLLFYGPLATSIFLSIHFPFFVSACFLIAFYWQQILAAKSVQHLAGFGKYLIPCIVVLVALAILEFVTDLLRGINRHTRILPWVTTALYLLAVFCAGLFLVISGSRLLRSLSSYFGVNEQVNKSTAISSTHSKVRRLTIFLLWLGQAC